MSRSGCGEYDGSDQWEMIRWGGALKSAMRGKRGQAFFKELLDALDALPSKRLIAEDLMDENGEVCALGAVGLARGMPDLVTMDSELHFDMSRTFDIARAMIQEIEWQNDDLGCHDETPEQRWVRVRTWVLSKIREPVKAT